MRWSLLAILWFATALASAQESALHADFRRESERFREACRGQGDPDHRGFNLKVASGCAVELFTDHPLHIAAGSIAPQNGFGLGPAFVTHYTPNENWRFTWNADAIGSTNGSWRAGAYMKIIHTPVEPIRIIRDPNGKQGKVKLAVRPHTVFNVYVQSISLNKLNFFGLGPDSVEADRSVFGMRQTIAGANVIKPLHWVSQLNLSMMGEINGRFVELRGNHGDSSPSIEQLYDETTAPGLTNQPAFVQFGEGVRIKPVLFHDRLELNYLGNFQQFFAPSNSHYTFLRWTVDLGHNFNLYGHTQSGPRETNGPNECAPAVGAEKCPPVSYSRNLQGSIGMRILLSESMTTGTSVAPFFFQQTLGGSDINGSPGLSSYQDYRFRAPNLLLLQESFEHSIWGPFGVKFMADQGRVALTRGDVGFSHLKHTFAGGLTLRAGGFPMVSLMFAWGGPEGHHNIVNMNTSLLGGSARPWLD